MAPTKSQRPKKRPKDFGKKKVSDIDLAVIEALNFGNPSGVAYYDSQGNLRSPEQDFAPEKEYKGGGKVMSKGYARGGKVMPKGMANGGKVMAKGMANGGKVMSKGYANGGKVMPKGMANGGRVKAKGMANGGRIMSMLGAA